MHHLRGHPMQTTKEAARQAIDRLPDQATWEDIMYELYVKQKIEAGLRAAEEGRTIAHEEMKRRISAKKRHAKSAGLPICTAGGCPEGVLELIHALPAVIDREAFVRDGRAGDVAAKAFEGVPLMGSAARAHPRLHHSGGRWRENPES